MAKKNEKLSDITDKELVIELIARLNLKKDILGYYIHDGYSERDDFFENSLISIGCGKGETHLHTNFVFDKDNNLEYHAIYGR